MVINLETKPFIEGTNTANNVTFLTNLTAKTESKPTVVPILSKNKEGYNPESFVCLTKTENKKDSDKTDDNKNKEPKTLLQTIKDKFKSIVKVCSGLGTIGSTIAGSAYGAIAGKMFAISYLLSKIGTSGILGKIITVLSAKNVIVSCKIFGKIGGGIVGLAIGLLAAWGIEKLLEDKPQQEQQPQAVAST